MFVSMLVTVTVTPGMIPPEASRTVPEMAPRVICADTGVGSVAVMASIATRPTATRNRRDIDVLPRNGKRNVEASHPARERIA